MKKSFVVALLASVITSTAFAADELVTSGAPDATPPSGKTTFVGIDIGTVSGYLDSQSTITSGLTASGWGSVSVSQNVSSAAVNIHGGQWLSEHLGWEAGYSDFGKVTGTVTAYATPQSYFGSYSYSASTAYAAVLGAIPFGSSKLYGKAGLHSTSTKTDFNVYRYNYTTLSTNTGSTTKSSTGFVLGGGYEYAFNKSWAIRADVTMFNGAQFTSAWNLSTTENKTLIQTAIGVDFSF
jgi:opacity protein-like surface antigen